MRKRELLQMIGFGAIGEGAIGEAGYSTRALTSDILQQVVTQLVDVDRLLPSLPSRLHHFTALGTAAQIVEKDNVRLSHAEYSNDQTEMARAKEVISAALHSRSSQHFFADVLTEYEKRALDLDAYIFCMSMDKPTVGQDILSQWRAYGQDGRGVALTLDAGRLSRIIQNVPTLRINPVIYDNTTQITFVDRVLAAGLASASSNPSAVDATAAALVFATPLMKAAGFEEEREWRLIFMPPPLNPAPTLQFHPRRDFLAPFFDLSHIWNRLRTQLLEIAELRATLPTSLPVVSLPLIPIQEVMIGPSGHQELSVRSFKKLLNQSNRGGVTVGRSQIPYRSLG
jgi:hypothetical protein